MTAPLTIGRRIVAAGLYFNTSREEYDALDLLNYSRAKRIDCPAKFLHACEHPGASDSNTLKLGRVIHIAILEPDLYASRIAVWTKRTKADAASPRNGQEWEDFKALHAGKEIILPDEDVMAQGMRKSVFREPRARELLTGGRSEVTALAKLGDWYCKSRFDYVSSVLPDLKSTRSARREDFAWDAHRYNYAAQAAFYSDVHEAATGERKQFYNIAIEKEPPYVASIFRMPEEAIRIGRKTYRGWMNTLADCISRNDWPGYVKGECDLVLPKRAMQEVADGSPLSA